MRRLRVVPDALTQTGNRFEQFSQGMQQLRSSLDRAQKGIEWESIIRPDMERLAQAALRQAAEMADWAHRMGATLSQLRENYLSEDRALAGSVGRVAGVSVGRALSSAVAVSTTMGVRSLEGLGLRDAQPGIATPARLGYVADDASGMYRAPYAQISDPGSFPGLEYLSEGDLKFIQHVLRIPSTGHYDETTKSALAELQWEHRFAIGINDRDDADGVIGPRTWQVLRAINHSQGVDVVINNHDMNLLITDEAFLDKDAMSLRDIRSFLKERNSILASDEFPIYRLATQAPDVAGAIWHEERKVWKVPTGQTFDPAQAIYEAAQRHGINPLVLLTKLEKESSLISSFQDGERMDPTWISTVLGMGFGVPDGGRIDLTRTGLDVQIEEAARRSVEMFYEEAPSKYPHVYTPLNYGVTSDVMKSGVTVPWSLEVENRATWVLYRYTPHVVDTKLKELGGGNLLFAQLFEEYRKEVGY